MTDQVHQAYIAIGDLKATYGEGMYMGYPNHPARYYRQKENFEAITKALDDLYAKNEQLRQTLKQLSFAAQTSGGTAGRDEALMTAIADADQVLAGDDNDPG